MNTTPTKPSEPHLISTPSLKQQIHTGFIYELHSLIRMILITNLTQLLLMV